VPDFAENDNDRLDRARPIPWRRFLAAAVGIKLIPPLAAKPPMNAEFV
jgi:hypothetical protein